VGGVLVDGDEEVLPDATISLPSLALGIVTRLSSRVTTRTVRSPMLCTSP
jgi:hypothetical protein